MLSFRVVFKLWPVVLGAVLCGLAIRLMNGSAAPSDAAHDDQATANVELREGNVAALKDRDYSSVTPSGIVVVSTTSKLVHIPHLGGP